MKKTLYYKVFFILCIFLQYKYSWKKETRRAYMKAILMRSSNTNVHSTPQYTKVSFQT